MVRVIVTPMVTMVIIKRAIEKNAVMRKDLDGNTVFIIRGPWGFYRATQIVQGLKRASFRIERNSKIALGTLGCNIDRMQVILDVENALRERWSRGLRREPK